MVRTKLADYPSLGVNEAIDAAKKIVSTFKDSEISVASLAQALGHKTEKSGTFLLKLADLRKYKLLEGRGMLHASELAKRIANPLNENEKNSAINEMIFNIALFKQLNDVLQTNRNPTKEDFDVHLLNITHVDRAHLADISDEIRKFYIDAVAYISMQNFAQPLHGIQTPPKKDDASMREEIKTESDMTHFVEEGIDIKVKKDKEHIETAIAFLNIQLAKFGKKKE